VTEEVSLHTQDMFVIMWTSLQMIMSAAGL